MFLFKGCNASVKVLREDAFYVLVSLQKYMKSKLKDKDHVFYYNYKGTNQDYWGESYTYLEKIVLLPIEKQKKIEYVVFNESSYGENYILFYYNQRGYEIDLHRKHKGLEAIMDRIQEIFKIEDEVRFFPKQWMYFKYLLK